jgi:acyl carrier protein
VQNAYELILSYLIKTNKDNEIQSLSNALDSLDRLELVEFLSKHFNYDFNSVLIEPSAWINLKSLSEVIERLLSDK